MKNDLEIKEFPENNFPIKELNYNSEEEIKKVHKLSKRSATDNDWDILTRYSLFEDNDEERTKVFVVFDDRNIIIGFITFYKPPDILYAPSDQPFIIWDIYVEHKSRGKGIGTKLANKYFEIEKISKIPIVNCSISDGMKGVLLKISDKWIGYKNMGFVIIDSAEQLDRVNYWFKNNTGSNLDSIMKYIEKQTF